MNVVFLIHHESEDVPPMRVAASMICALYGYHLCHVDLVGDLLAVSSEPYASLAEALADPRFDSWDWVFIDPRAEKSLREFEHPENNVVYAFGSDRSGFKCSVEDLPGEAVHLPSQQAPTYEHQQLTCVGVVATHRFFQVSP